MPVIYPIPTGRSSDYLVQKRLLSQLQSDQLELLKIQNQISTGRRISRPSEDAAAAQRGIGLQRIIEEKKQVRSNLATTTSYLNATDVALSSVSNVIAEMRAVAVGSAQTTISDSQRAANAVQVQQALQSLVEIGNHSFRDRHLFAGSKTGSGPFSYAGNNVVYSGNDTTLRSYADIGLLVGNNVTGDDAFGAVSPQVRGSADLNPVVLRSTRLADLRNGQGISSGSIQVSDGINTQTIDLSHAETVDDVIRAIERNPPAGRTLTVRLTPTGLTIDIDDAGGGNFTITEVGDGTTAHDLGIYNRLGTVTSPIVGSDLNPQLTLTTRLADLLGTRPTAYVSSSASNNDLIIEALQNGSAYNGVTIQFVDDQLLHASSPLLAGQETVSYSAAATGARAALKLFGLNNNLLLTAATAGTTFNDVRIDIVNAGAIGNNATVSYSPGSKVLTLGIDSSGATDVQTLINQINAEGTFTAAYDSSDPTDGGFIPTAAVPISNAISSIGNTGNSGGQAKTLFVNIQPGATTAAQVVTAINQDPIVSQLFAAQVDPSDTTLATHAGQGLINVDSTAQTSGGTGQSFDKTSGLRVNNGGQTHIIDVSTAVTVEDFLNILNRSPANLVASINAAANGLDVRSNLSGSDFSISENGGTTATQLGIRSFAASTPLSDLNYGRGVQTITGPEFQIQRTDGVVLNIDISSAVTIQDVLNILNAAGGVQASLTTQGNGIVLQDTAGGAGSFSITKDPLSSAAWDLGILPVNQGTAVGTGVPPTLTGTDVNPLEVKGIFNSLLRLHSALTSGNIGELERIQKMLDDDLSRLVFSRGNVGAQQQNLDALTRRLEDEDVELNQALSTEIDSDLPESISNLTARQASLQASLQLSSRVFKLTLLDFL